MTISDGDFLDLDDEDGDDLVPVAVARRAKKAYHVATVRPFTSREAALTGDSLFDLDDLVERAPLGTLSVTQADVLAAKGTRRLTAISSFTGCGGSATGFAWAGWNELMAVEFVKAARETLAANYPSFIVEPEEVLAVAVPVAERLGIALVLHRPKKVKGGRFQPSLDWETTLAPLDEASRDLLRLEVCTAVFAGRPVDQMAIWGDDIRGLHPQAVLDYLGLKVGELDLKEGSPPCKTFSTSGLREEGWGQVLHYSDERDQQTDDLFWEYLRILKGFMPRAFVAENVAGLQMGAADVQVMQPLLQAFRDLGYRVEARLVNSADYDVPQSRPRIIIIGVRQDQYHADGRPALPQWPRQSEVGYTVRDALELASPLNTPLEVASAWLGSLDDLRAHLDGEVPASILEAWPKTVHAGRLDLTLESDSDAAKKPVPLPDDYCRYETGLIWHSLPVGSAPQSKAYQLIRCHPDQPAPTITATSAGNQPAAGPTHPHECRKFTVPEYRALFGFPSDYVFTGNVDQQGERMGRSVPPYLMKQIADTLGDLLENCSSDGSMTF